MGACSTPRHGTRPLLYPWHLPVTTARASGSIAAGSSVGNDALRHCTALPHHRLCVATTLERERDASGQAEIGRISRQTRADIDDDGRALTEGEGRTDIERSDVRMAADDRGIVAAFEL